MVPRYVVVFAAAFAVFEATLLAFSLALGGSEGFTLPVLAEIFTINSLALIGFLIVKQGGILTGMIDSVPSMGHR